MNAKIPWICNPPIYRGSILLPTPYVYMSLNANQFYSTRSLEMFEMIMKTKSASAQVLYPILSEGCPDLNRIIHFNVGWIRVAHAC